jgi:hypothetical protein
VLGQSYGDFEHLIIDGASTDRTLSLLRQYKDPRLKIVSEPDSGIYDAWNKGLAMASGDWILFIGGDDFLMAGDILDRVQSAILLDPEQPAFVSCRLSVGTRDGLNVRRTSPFGWGTVNQILSSPVMSMPAHGALFHSRGIFDSGIKFDASYHGSADKKLFLECIGFANIQYLDVITTYFSIGGITTSSGNKCRRWMEKRRLRRDLRIPFLPWAYLKSFMSSVLRDAHSVIRGRL